MSLAFGLYGCTPYKENFKKMLYGFIKNKIYFTVSFILIKGYNHTTFSVKYSVYRSLQVVPPPIKRVQPTVQPYNLLKLFA